MGIAPQDDPFRKPQCGRSHISPDRIEVISGPPGKITEIMEMRTRGPRDRSDAQYGQMASEILDTLEKEAGF
ncbi:MAG: hypothetical protein AB1733_24375 [Thermodesulfobacteriota bacterium]